MRRDSTGRQGMEGHSRKRKGPGHRERRYEITESLESARRLGFRRQAVEMGYGKDL